MTKLNIILFILILSQIGTVFATPSNSAKHYYLVQELIQSESILDIQDLLCIDDCEQDTMIAQVTSINQALSVNDGK